MPPVIPPLERVSCFIDGFNLYHALDDLRQPHLKWLDLRRLMKRYAPQTHQRITNVYYFSAFATWRPGPYRRHRTYVEALKRTGVIPVMGLFKEKERSCIRCGTRWKTHEEKETDVNIALWMLNEAYRGSYDHAFLLTNDSDLTSAVRMVKQQFLRRRIRIITPPGRITSKALASASGGMGCVRTIRESHVHSSLLPSEVSDATGGAAVRCPDEYLLPASAG